MIVEGAPGESSNAGQDLIRALRPHEGLRIGVVGVDEGPNGRLELGDTAVHAAANVLVR
jgi:hypothetical protein